MVNKPLSIYFTDSPNNNFEKTNNFQSIFALKSARKMQQIHEENLQRTQNFNEKTVNFFEKINKEQKGTSFRDNLTENQNIASALHEKEQNNKISARARKKNYDFLHSKNIFQQKDYDNEDLEKVFFNNSRGLKKKFQEKLTYAGNFQNILLEFFNI